MYRLTSNTKTLKYPPHIAEAREQCIRNGSVLPDVGNVTEQQWAKEGQQAKLRDDEHG